MKKNIFHTLIFLLTMVSCSYSYAKDFKSLWDDYNTSSNKNLTRDALNAAENIYQMAQKENNTEQKIKALLHIYKNRIVIEENSDENIVNDLKKAILEAKNPDEQALLKVLLARAYYTYYTGAQYKIIQRTYSDELSPDFTMWDAKQFQQQIANLYFEVLEDDLSLEKYPLDEFDEIVTYNKKSKYIFSLKNLSDLLYQEALTFFSAKNIRLTEVKNAFEINDVKYFSPLNAFLDLKIKDENSSNDAVTLQLFQRWMKKLKDRNDDILGLIDQQRLKFVNDNFVGANQLEEYAKSLEKGEEFYQAKDAKSVFAANLIQLHYNHKSDFSTDEKKIVTEIKNLQKKYPNSFGAGIAESILTQIQTKSLNVQLENIQASQKKWKVLVQYQNIPSVKYKIVEWKEIKTENRYYNIEDRWKELSKLKVVRDGTFKLPATDDYLSHSIEFAMSELPFGKYALIVYTEDLEKNFNNGKYTVTQFTVSDMAAVFRNNQQDVYLTVYDRISGLSLKQVQVEVQIYNNSKTAYETVQSGFTNDIGEFKLNKSNIISKSYRINLKKAQDVLSTNGPYVYKENLPSAPKWTTSVRFFTDRAIYRPGQKVYFKTIVTESKEDSIRPVTNRNISVTLKDANWQKVSEQTFSSNEWGGISGVFTLPEGGLNGNFTLETPYGSTSFLVEEYKRPTFEVTFEDFKGHLKLGDTITAKGKALAYSGVNISDARVNYLVTRKGFIPIWRYYGRFFPQSDKAVVASGTVITDEEGNFEIPFLAKTDKSGLDIYSYEISVDVADMTGEVRSNTTHVRIGKLTLLPTVSIDGQWSPNTVSQLKVSSKNLQNQDILAKFDLVIEYLIVPTHPKKDKNWQTPDQASMTEAEYQKIFPYDNYKEAATKDAWKVKSKVWSQSVEVFGDSVLNILPQNLPTGFYRLTANVKDGDEIITLKNTFEIKKRNENTIAPDFLKVTADKSKYQAGETAVIAINSDLPKAYVYGFITQGNKVVKDTLFVLNGKTVYWDVTTNKSTVDVNSVYFEMVAQDRLFKKSLQLEVQRENYNDLSFQWETFRNKLLPGAQEKWSLKILDKDKNLADVELLATMYDASLDQFSANEFYFNIYLFTRSWYNSFYNQSYTFGAASTGAYTGNAFNRYISSPYWDIPSLNYFGFSLADRYSEFPIMYMRATGAAGREDMVMKQAMRAAPIEEFADTESVVKEEDDKVLPPEPTLGENIETEEITHAYIRKNFDETAFFFPQVVKGKDGLYSFEFTLPEALTTWKFLAFAHTKNLHYTIFEDRVVSQKDVMIQMNKPRFVRVGDIVYLNARASNLTEGNLTAKASIIFRDANTNEDVTQQVLQTEQNISLELPANGNANVEWKIGVPKNIEGLVYEVSIQTEHAVDGESDLIPVLENRILLTESAPIFINKKGDYCWTIEDCIPQTASSELKAITFEYTAQPVWHALLALPYLNEQKDASATSLFYRYYAHTLGAYILKTIPQSKELLEAWKKEGSLQSALEKNQELKTVVLEATPWLRDAQDETAQMQQLYQLLEDATDVTGKDQLLKKLVLLQDASGGVSWYPGMPANRSLTQNIVTDFYRLQKLGVIRIEQDRDIQSFTQKALQYLEAQNTKVYNDIIKRDSNYLNKDYLGYTEIQYLYLLSITGKKWNKAETYFYNQAKKYVLNKNQFAQAMIAIVLNSSNDKKQAQDILKGMIQSAVVSKKDGMYWKANTGYFWYNAPIERQAMIIQAFDEVLKDNQTIDQLKLWLLRQKQTSRWAQPRATVDAVYVLLLTGGDWKKSSDDKIYYDKKKVDDTQLSAGTAYVKTTWQKDDVPASIEIKKTSNTPSWGAIYYQYWEDLDQVKYSFDELQVKRTLYKVFNTDAGETLTPITEQTPLQKGDKVRIKLELKIDRDVEFFHLQDTRSTGFEPVNVLSGYKYQGGLGYYEVNGDVATHWFMDRINKGNYVFEYTVTVNIAGQYSSGVTIGECLYAPEFRFQSNGIKIEAKN
ncbi:MAG: MG2 domain-containing protein [Chitinophagales bacterium]|nr:MG2 domain-containing protein [Chitinophagales bacterium]